MGCFDRLKGYCSGKAVEINDDSIIFANPTYESSDALTSDAFTSDAFISLDQGHYYLKPVPAEDAVYAASSVFYKEMQNPVSAHYLEPVSSVGFEDGYAQPGDLELEMQDLGVYAVPSNDDDEEHFDGFDKEHTGVGVARADSEERYSMPLSGAELQAHLQQQCSGAPVNRRQSSAYEFDEDQLIMVAPDGKTHLVPMPPARSSTASKGLDRKPTEKSKKGKLGEGAPLYLEPVVDGPDEVAGYVEVDALDSKIADYSEAEYLGFGGAPSPIAQRYVWHGGAIYALSGAGDIYQVLDEQHEPLIVKPNNDDSPSCLTQRQQWLLFLVVVLVLLAITAMTVCSKTDYCRTPSSTDLDDDNDDAPFLLGVTGKNVTALLQMGSAALAEACDLSAVLTEENAVMTCTALTLAGGQLVSMCVTQPTVQAGHAAGVFLNMVTTVPVRVVSGATEAFNQSVVALWNNVNAWDSFDLSSLNLSMPSGNLNVNAYVVEGLPDASSNTATCKSGGRVAIESLSFTDAIQVNGAALNGVNNGAAQPLNIVFNSRLSQMNNVFVRVTGLDPAVHGSLSRGTFNANAWTMSPDDLSALAIQPRAGVLVNTNIQIEIIGRNPDGTTFGSAAHDIPVRLDVPAPTQQPVSGSQPTHSPVRSTNAPVRTNASLPPTAAPVRSTGAPQPPPQRQPTDAPVRSTRAPQPPPPPPPQAQPTGRPTTGMPQTQPTARPTTGMPQAQPTVAPTVEPTALPSRAPQAQPTGTPTLPRPVVVGQSTLLGQRGRNVPLAQVTFPASSNAADRCWSVRGLRLTDWALYPGKSGQQITQDNQLVQFCNLAQGPSMFNMRGSGGGVRNLVMDACNAQSCEQVNQTLTLV